MGVFKGNSPIVFSNQDLLDHNQALYIVLECMDSKIPKVLVDNDYSLNVCPLHTATKLGIKVEDLTPSSLTVRAYDNTSQGVMGTFKCNCKMKPMDFSTTFHVLDITTSYNLLLGRTWIHPLKVVPLNLHQKLKIPQEGRILTMEGEGEISSCVYEIEKEIPNLFDRGFQAVQTLKCVEKKKKESDSDRMPNYSRKVIEMMNTMGFAPGYGLGRNNQGPKMREQPNSPIGFFRSVYLWRVKPKIPNV